nr:regulatory protein RecX [uncultured Aminipila sp.]
MNINQKIKTEDSVQKKKSPIDVALKHLANRDRTCQEIKKHLNEKEYSTDEIEETVDYLLEMNYLNDELYIEKYIEYAVSKGKGSAKIKGELRNKGVDKQLIDEVVSCSETLASQNERERAYIEALKIVQNVKIEDLSDCDNDFNRKAQKFKELQRIKAKVARKLESRGYSRNVIFDIIDNIFNS